MDNAQPENVTSSTHPNNYAKQNIGMKVWAFSASLLLAIAIAIIITHQYVLSKWTLSNPSTIGKLCTGVNVVFFPGGTPQDSFASVVYNGAKQAQSDLGANVSYVWSGWDANKMVSQFIDAVSAHPDAIAMMGHPGSQALSPLIDEAERKGIIVTLQNVDIPDIRTNYTNQGFGYVGQNLYNSGLLVANGVLRKYTPKAGTEAIVFGVNPNTEPSRHVRTQGIVDGLTKGNLVVHEIAMPTDVEDNANSPAVEKFISDALTKYPNVKIIIIDHGQVTSSSPAILKKLGKKPGEYIVAGFDLSANTVEGIKNGYISLIQDQQPYLQGYLPVLQACLTKKYGFAGLYVNTGVGLVDNSNVNQIEGLAQQQIR